MSKFLCSACPIVLHHEPCLLQLHFCDDTLLINVNKMFMGCCGGAAELPVLTLVRVRQQSVRVGQQSVRVGQQSVRVGQQSVRVGQQSVRVGQQSVGVGQRSVATTAQLQQT